MTDYEDLTLEEVLDKIGELGRYTSVGLCRTSKGWQINCKVGNTVSYQVRISQEAKMGAALLDGLKPQNGETWDSFCEPEERDAPPYVFEDYEYRPKQKSKATTDMRQITMDDLI